MRRTVCMECVAVCGLMQLLMTYLVVYMVMSPTSEVVHSDSRLLLSLQDPTGPKMEARLVFYPRGVHKLNNKVRGRGSPLVLCQSINFACMLTL